MTQGGERAILHDPSASGSGVEPDAGAGPAPDPEEALHALERRQAFLLDFNDEIRVIGDPFAIMERATELLGLHLKVGRVGYGEIDAAQEHLSIERDWTDPLMPSVAGRYRLHDFGPSVIRELRHGLTVAVGDISTDPRTSRPASLAAYSAISTRAILAVPLVKGGRLSALLFVHHPEPRPWLGGDVKLVEDVAERTWAAVERSRAESALRKSEERLRLSQEAGGVGLWDWDLGSDEIFWSDKQYEILGAPRGIRMTGHLFKSLIHPDDRAAAMAATEAALRGEGLLETEFRIMRPADGRAIWLAARGEVRRDAEGRPKRIVGVNFDITGRKKAEAGLRQSAERLQLALRAARMGDWTWDATTDFVLLSDRAAEIFGVPVDPPMTWTAMRSMLHPADAQKAAQAVETAVETNTLYDIEYRVRRSADGAKVWVAAQGQCIHDPDGTLVGITGVVQDISERKRTEERQHLLIRELHHRVKNTLATVQAIVGSTARTASSIEDFYESFVGRIVSLAQTHNLLTEDYWQKASLAEMLRNELGPFDDGKARVTLAGPPVELTSEAAVPIGMAIHELTTNAVKHGALSIPGGSVEVLWRVIEDEEASRLVFAWTERGGPPVQVPSRQGFGSRLLQRVLATQLQADVQMDFDPDGIRFRMNVPLPRDATLLNLLS
jgi:PAS domain S-box-containing protein